MRTFLLFTIFLLQGCTLTAGIGGAFAPNVPREYITGHEQFHLSIEGEAPLRKMIELMLDPAFKLPPWVDMCSIEVGAHHYSNGADIGIGRYPNQGLDFLGAQVKIKFLDLP